MTSSNGHFSRITGLLWATGEFPSQRPVTRSFAVFFDMGLDKQLSINREAGDLRRHRTHYGVIVMFIILRDIGVILGGYIHFEGGQKRYIIAKVIIVKEKYYGSI